MIHPMDQGDDPFKSYQNEIEMQFETLDGRPLIRPLILDQFGPILVAESRVENNYSIPTVGLSFI